MHKDIVSIIVRLLKRFWMHKINKQYREEYEFVEIWDYISHSIKTIKCGTANIKYNFMFNYRTSENI